MSDSSPAFLPFHTVAIVGVGLIGGSIAAALKKRQLASQVIGVGRDSARLEAARISGLIDVATTHISDAVEQADLVVFCTPVDRLADDVAAAAKLVAPGRKLPLFTDVGSTKESICQRLQSVPNFVGSHPIAGSHQRGFEAADADLFQNRVCVVTPHNGSTNQDVGRLEQFWRSIGMTTLLMSPAEHDEALAITSHLPHVVASALAIVGSEQDHRLFGTGFRDTTRIAAGADEIWTSILVDNSRSIISGIEAMEGQLAQFKDAIEQQDVAKIKELLQTGKSSRQALDRPNGEV